jgi:hypothetical protein
LLTGIAAHGTGADTSAAADPDRRIESLVRDWYSLLARQSLESCAVDDLVAESPFGFSLAGGSVSGPGELQAWISELRSAYPQVEYRLDVLRTQALDDGSYRAQFELNRRAVDEAGVTHVARRRQTWTIRDVPGARPEVLRIDEERLLAFPGTGPQIVCY